MPDIQDIVTNCYHDGLIQALIKEGTAGLYRLGGDAWRIRPFVATTHPEPEKHLEAWRLKVQSGYPVAFSSEFVAATKAVYPGLNNDMITIDQVRAGYRIDGRCIWLAAFGVYVFTIGGEAVLQQRDVAAKYDPNCIANPQSRLAGKGLAETAYNAAEDDMAMIGIEDGNHGPEHRIYSQDCSPNPYKSLCNNVWLLGEAIEPEMTQAFVYLDKQHRSFEGVKPLQFFGRITGAPDNRRGLQRRGLIIDPKILNLERCTPVARALAKVL